MLLTDIRKSRKIQGQLQTGINQHVAYLGLYNPSPFIGRIGNSLKNLELSSAKSRSMLIVDNASNDGSQEEVSNLVTALEALGWQVLFVRNPINLGGWGSLQLNLDLIKDFNWVTTFHQDDLYAPDHIEINIRLSEEVEENVALISREAVSVDSKGRILGYPRAAWFMADSPSPEQVFIGLLRNHFLPFSGSAFRLKFLNDYQIPWTSTAFPDTELLLSGIPKWSYTYSSQSQVTYLENPTSESHSLGQISRDFGAALAILRVFEREGFSSLTSNLSPERFSRFIDDLELAIKSRLRDQELARLIFGHGLQLAMESRAKSGVHSDYAALEKIYCDVGDTFAANLAKRLGEFALGSTTVSVRELNLQNHAESKYRTPKTVILRSLGKLPKETLKKFWQLVHKSSFFRKIFPHWDI
jgi:hypothetical protein